MDALRGLAILLVVYHHGIGQAATISDVPRALLSLDDFLDPFRMPALMILSGMLLPRSLAKSPAEFLSGKAGKVLWPYLLWSVIVVSAVGLYGGGLDLTDYALILYDPPTYLWYLAILFVYYLIALLVPSRFHPLIGLLGWLSSFAVDWAFVGPLTNAERFTYLIGFFFLGQIIANNRTKFDAAAKNPWVLLVSILIGGAGAALSVAGVAVSFSPIFVVVPIAGFLVMYRLALRIQPIFLQCIGAGSLVFYVTHFLVIMTASALLGRLGVTWWQITAPALLLTAVGAGYVGVFLSRRPVTSWLFALPESGQKRRTQTNEEKAPTP
ncbi:acyltransferase family protein [Arthrobacter agilis]|uniref:acyltransferase family protein n=1 Tax=Arthrobacter agilis TaxID=37921 RepID=UPI00277FF4DA|nr:acyltransferase [Arthrobacter agilis]MDQ0735345.1 fucose 4-O-acetylase-like acetyltransferase [Arthrobacter agilis]